MFYGLDGEYNSVAVTNLGKRNAGFNELEQIEEGRENIRAAVAGKAKERKNLRCFVRNVACECQNVSFVKIFVLNVSFNELVTYIFLNSKCLTYF